jgi:rRNA maturation protein Nop10
MEKTCPECGSKEISLNPPKVNIENPNENYKYPSGVTEKMNKCNKCGYTFD